MRPSFDSASLESASNVQCGIDTIFVIQPDHMAVEEWGQVVILAVTVVARRYETRDLNLTDDCIRMMSGGRLLAKHLPNTRISFIISDSTVVILKKKSP